MSSVFERTEPDQIHGLLADVMADVKAVGKTGRNEAQNFSFRGIDGVLNAVGPVFRKHRVVVLPTLEDLTTSSVEVGKNRTLMGHVVVKVRYSFFAPDGSYVEAVVPGEAFDSGDKAISKAMSVAYRTALIQVLTLPTHEADSDATAYERASAAEPAPGMTNTQRAAISDLLAEVEVAGLSKEIREWWKGERLPKKERLTPEEAGIVIMHIEDALNGPRTEGDVQAELGAADPERPFTE